MKPVLSNSGAWKFFDTGYTAAPIVIYVGEHPPYVTKDGQLRFPVGTTYIGEFSSQNGHIDQRDDWIPHDNHLAAIGYAELRRRAKVMVDALENDPLSFFAMDAHKAALELSELL